MDYAATAGLESKDLKEWTDRNKEYIQYLYQCKGFEANLAEAGVQATNFVIEMYNKWAYRKRYGMDEYNMAGEVYQSARLLVFGGTKAEDNVPVDVDDSEYVKVEKRKVQEVARKEGEEDYEHIFLGSDEHDIGEDMEFEEEGTEDVLSSSQFDLFELALARK